MEHLLLKAATTATDKGTFTAVISTADIDREGDIVEPTAMVTALSKWATLQKLVPLAWNHTDEVIGHIDPASAEIRGDEVIAKGWVDRNVDRGKEAWRLIKSGTFSFSFGYLIPKGGATKLAGGRLRIKELDVFEISGVPILPANNGTRVLDWKSADHLREQAREIEREAEEAQIPDVPPSEPDPLQKALAALDPAADTDALATAISDLPLKTGERLFVRVVTSDEIAGVTDGHLKAVWSTAYINNLPDSAFLHIESGGSKDSEGKTTPRSLRHFPYKDADGKVDLPHLRNALSRIPQSNLPDTVKERLTRRAQQILDQQKSVDVTDKAPEARSVDTLRQQAETVELEFASGGESLRRPPRKAAPKPPDLIPLADLKRRMRDEMLRHLSGDTP